MRQILFNFSHYGQSMIFVDTNLWPY